MYKLLLILMFYVALNAKMIDAVAVVVDDEPITTFDIKEQMRVSHLDSKKATDILIRKKLEENEIKKKKISVSSDEVYKDIEQTASRNNMSVSQFYDAVRNSNGLTSSQLKEKIKEKIQSQKLYSSIAYASMAEPTDSEIKDYYELHKKLFQHPSAFEVIIYVSKDKRALNVKVNNPMFYSPDIKQDEQTLPYNRISPELAKLLEKTPVGECSPIVPNGKGEYMSFYIKKVISSKKGDIDSVKEQIKNIIMADKREQVLKDYFARLRHSDNIKFIREVK